MKLIGKGSFTKCYLLDDKTVELHSCCYIKECMSLDWFPNSRLFPKIESIDYGIYRCKYYPKVRSLKSELKPNQYQIYKDLRALSLGYINNKHDYLDKWIEEFKTLKNKRLKEIMLQAIQACSNYGSDIGFEISPRNVAVNNGNLILLDCFYSISQLQQTRKY